MSIRIEAVIFDWAGTVVDYGCFAPVEAFRQAFEEAGIHPAVEEIRKPMGLSKRLHVQTMLEMPRITALWQEVHGRPWTDEDADRVYARSEERILSLLPDYAEPIPHVLDAVNRLRERGIKIGSTTGYNDEMMGIVVPAAEKVGYKPDCWFSSDSTNKLGRPYPYMIFRAMETLQVSSVKAAVKVGDMAADIREGQNAGLITVGLIEGSSLMALSREEYEALPPEQQQAEIGRVCKAYADCGADYVIRNMSELPELLERIETTA